MKRAFLLLLTVAACGGSTSQAPGPITAVGYVCEGVFSSAAWLYDESRKTYCYVRRASSGELRCVPCGQSVQVCVSNPQIPSEPWDAYPRCTMTTP